MNSIQLGDFSRDFLDWYPFNKQTDKEPLQLGVYVIRMLNAKCFGGLKGDSDIIHIGKTETQKGIRGRLTEYFRKPGPTQWTNQRVHKLMESYDWEVA